jgi:hypothetical protein
MQVATLFWFLVALIKKGGIMEDKSLWKASAMLLLVGLLLGGLMWYWNKPEMASTPQQAAGSDAAVPLAAPATETVAIFASPFTTSASSPATTSITGRWGGEIDIGGKKALFNFNLREAEGLLAGTATFPVGEGSIEDGKIANNQLSFATRHRLPLNGQTIVTKFSGTVGDGTISLTMLSEGGESRLTLNPQPR